MTANATPDSPAHADTGPAAEEPAWIEVGSPKRRNPPPAWADEVTHDAWSAHEESTGTSDPTAAPARIELIEAADPAARDAALTGSGASAEHPERPEEREDSMSSPTRSGDWEQGPVPSAAEASTTASAEAGEATEPLDLSRQPTAELEIPAVGPPNGLDDPESADRWQVVRGDATQSAAPQTPGDDRDAAGFAAGAPARPADDEVEAEPAAQAAARAETLRIDQRPAGQRSADRRSADRRSVDQRPADPAPAPVVPAPTVPSPTATARDAAATSSAETPGDAEDPASRTGRAEVREGSGTLSGALDLIGPEMRAHRPALIVGLVTLVLSIWMLVALPFPLKYSIDAALAVAGAETTAPDGIGAPPRVALWSAAGALAALVALQAGFRALSVASLNRAGGRVAADLRGRLFGHLHRFSPGRDLDDLGRTTTPLVEDVAHLRDLVAHSGPRILGGVLALASLLGVLLVVEPIAAAVVIVTGGLHALVASSALGARGRRETAAAADEAVLADTAEELLTATRTIQSYGLEQRAEHSLAELGSRAARSRTTARRSRAVGRALTELVAGLGVGAALLVGGWRMTSGTMTAGELTMVIAYVLLSAVLVREVVQHSAALPDIRTAGDRVGRLLAHRAVPTEAPRTQPIDRLRGEVVYSALSVTGPHGTLFDRISLVIPAGEHVALVGREGSEASALLSYLQRFDEPDTGRVLLDRFDSRLLALADLRRQLAVVQREPALFTETVRENIRVGRPEASDDEIVEAARRSGADEFITLLPEGYDTLLTRRGAGLSDGQRRRLAITRALLRDAPVVVLDGADEELAPAERDAVRRALETLVDGRTALISSSDPATVLEADRVVCFESGDLAEDGVPAQLAADPDSWLTSWIHAMDVPTR